MPRLVRTVRALATIAIAGVGACAGGHHHGVAGDDTAGLPSDPQCVSVNATVGDTPDDVVRVDWTTDAPGTSTVAFGVGRTTLDRATPASDDASPQHTALLVGIAPLTEVWFDAAVDEAGGTVHCRGHAETGNLLPGMPTLTVS